MNFTPPKRRFCRLYASQPKILEGLTCEMIVTVDKNTVAAHRIAMLLDTQHARCAV